MRPKFRRFTRDSMTSLHIRYTNLLLNEEKVFRNFISYERCLSGMLTLATLRSVWHLSDDVGKYIYSSSHT